MSSTIAAISTPLGAGGIAMIRISGENACSVSEQVFSSASGKRVSEMHGYTCAYGTVSDHGEVLDDVVLTVFRAPHSYTGEDTVEITCHGGIYLTKRILGLIYRAGAEPAAAGEFTKRAFLNGKLSLSQAEAVMDVIRADGAAALSQATLAKDGRLGKQMREISERIVDMMSALAYWLDDAEECPPELEADTLLSQLQTLISALKRLTKGYENGRVLREGIRTVLLGRPNAGKSSVMNWLCGTDRSIVTSIAGTTRDVITEQVKIDDFTLVLSDTAGIREADDEIESIGITQAFHALDAAQLVLYVVDAAAGLSGDDRRTLDQCKKCKVIVLWNKIDLTDAPPPELPFPVLCCEAIHETDHDRLADLLREQFDISVSMHEPSLLNERQNMLVSRSLDALKRAEMLVSEQYPLDMLYSELESAAESLRMIEGDSVSDDVIDGVFSKFCVGK